ncbi:MAG: hypothetical protein ACREYB_00740 [Casimicrobiaceae bacterium]
MHRYKPSTPRVTLGITAVAMTAITLGVMIVLPASVAAGSHEPAGLMASSATPATSDGAAAGSAVDVVAAHDSGLAPTSCTDAQPNREPQG